MMIIKSSDPWRRVSFRRCPILVCRSVLSQQGQGSFRWESSTAQNQWLLALYASRRCHTTATNKQRRGGRHRGHDWFSTILRSARRKRSSYNVEVDTIQYHFDDDTVFGSEAQLTSRESFSRISTNPRTTHIFQSHIQHAAENKKLRFWLVHAWRVAHAYHNHVLCCHLQMRHNDKLMRTNLSWMIFWSW